MRNYFNIKKLFLYAIITIAFCACNETALAYSTTTLKQLYSETCICLDENCYALTGCWCEDWVCSGSTTQQVIIPETTTYATITNASLNTSSTILNWKFATSTFATITNPVASTTIAGAVATFPFYSATITSATSTILISQEWTYAELFFGFMATIALVLIILKLIFGFFYPARVRIQRKNE